MCTKIHASCMCGDILSEIFLHQPYMFKIITGFLSFQIHESYQISEMSKWITVSERRRGMDLIQQHDVKQQGQILRSWSKYTHHEKKNQAHLNAINRH